MAIHQIPEQRTAEPQDPRLSDALTAVDDDVRLFLQTRTVSVLGSNGVSVVPDEGLDSPMPKLIQAFLASPDDLLALSRSAAKALAAAQVGVNSPSGLLLVNRGTLEGKPGLQFLKLEHEQGVRVVDSTHNGKLIFKAEHIKELILGQRTKVYKIGLFHQVADEVLGIASDSQIGQRKKVASFFMQKFLGCRYAEDPQIQTERFLKVAETYFNNELDDASEKISYILALHSELRSPKETVRPIGFAREHLAEGHRDGFQRAMKVAKVSASFPKDTSLVDRHIKVQAVEFANGAKVYAPDNAWNDIERKTLEDGRLELTVTDALKAVRGR